MDGWIYRSTGRGSTISKCDLRLDFNNQRLPLGGARWCGTVHDGRPVGLFRPSYVTGCYLAFLGQLTAEKGPEAAIRIAHAAGMPLRIAAKIPRNESRYLKERLVPEIDGTQIQFVGELNNEAKAPFLAGAAALLFPIEWPEPFGLVMIEAMACGTCAGTCAVRKKGARQIATLGLQSSTHSCSDPALVSRARFSRHR
jgi:hypothetical protein